MKSNGKVLLIGCLSVIVSAALVACGGGGGGGGFPFPGMPAPNQPGPGEQPGQQQTFAIGGTAAGIDGSLTLGSGAGDELTLTKDGAFEFGIRVASGTNYNVTVLKQPDWQICAIAGAMGSVTADVRTVDATCTTGFQTARLAGPKFPERGFVDAQGNDARFSTPLGLAIDAQGTVYVTDLDNDAIRTITPDGMVRTILRDAAQFNTGLRGIAVDSSGTLYFASERAKTVLKLQTSGPDAGKMSIIANNIDGPRHVAVDKNGNVFISSIGLITKVDASGVVTTLKINENFFSPNGIVVDGEGIIYAVESGSRVVKISNERDVSLIAGSEDNGHIDGIGDKARFQGITSIARDNSGNLYVSDKQTIRVISPIGEVRTLAGKDGDDGALDGVGGAARFGRPAGIAVDASGVVYVADESNNTIRKIGRNVAP